MLVEFSITNYKSIREKVTLSMQASKDEEHPENTFWDSSKKFNLLKSVVLYGANASGKTNILDALYFICNLVKTSAAGLTEGDKIAGLKPFMLNLETQTSPSEFEVVFIVDNFLYHYGFVLDHKMIYEEWLHVADTQTKRMQSKPIFERRWVAEEKVYEYIDRNLKGEKKSLEHKTRSNALFLSVAAQWNNEMLKPVFGWFKQKVCHVDSSRVDIDLTASMASLSEVIYELILENMKLADLGITGFEIEEVSTEESLKKFPNEVRRLISGIFENADSSLKPQPSKKVKTLHKVNNCDEYVGFDLATVESLGTRRFFALLGFWITGIMRGCVLCIDELNNSLHPLLTESFINSIYKVDFGDKNPQAILTTHDTTLLSPDTFRRDQIWFAEKSQEGATDIYSLYDFTPHKGPKARKEEKFERNYLNGRYGAIPFIGEFKWLKENVEAPE